MKYLLGLTLVLAGCGSGLKSTKSNVNGATGGGSQLTSGLISCAMTAGTPSYYAVNLTLSLRGPIDRIILGDRLITPAIDPVTQSMVVNYTIPAPGPRTVTAVISNNAGAMNSCFAGFNAPTLEQARLASVPTGDKDFEYPQDLTFSDSNGDRYRYRLAVKKADGLVYWNAIPLDADVEIGRASCRERV